MSPKRNSALLHAIVAMALAASGLFGTVAFVAPTPAAADTTFTFEGGGYGHGVGMSQWGAKGRADAGQSVADIIGAYYPGTVITSVAMPGIRVHLDDTESTAITFANATTISGNGGAITSVAAGETLEVKAVGAGWQLQVIAPAAKPAIAVAANDTVIAPLNGSVASVSTTGFRYKNGRLVLRLASAGTVQIVNDALTMQQYLYGLAEVPSSWPVEALKAQALAARTYAYRRVLAPRSGNYDILSTTSDQVYSGFEKEAGASGARWLEAVNGTDQQIVTYNGAPIEALYGSSNGGYSEDSEYAFASVVPYLRSAADPYDNAVGNGLFRWSRSYSGTEMAQYLQAYRGVNIGVMTSFEVSGNISRVGRIDRASVKLIGTTGSYTITGAQLRNMINQSAPSNRQLMSTLLFFRPIGSFDAVTVRPGVVVVSGWALYQGSSTPALAHVYVNDKFAGAVEATGSRADVAAIVPGASANTGYAIPVAVDRAVNNVCAYAVSPSGTASTPLGCRTVTVATQPFGSLDFVAPTPGGVNVGGWAMDPNSAGAIDVHVYINGRFAGAVNASGDRPDVAAAFAAYGAQHGYRAGFPVSDAVNTVCAYAINTGPGDHQLLGCRTVTNSVQPFGNIDFVSASADGISIAGWAVDPDTAEPIAVHVYVDNVGTPLVADGERADIAAAFPGYGSQHGFTAKVAASAGSHTVCAYAINVRGGANQILGCRSVVVPANPFGNIDVVQATGSGIRVAGWAIDPNTTNPIEVHVYVGSAGTPLVADKPRGDLLAVFPASGADHGFDTVVSGRSGQTVCVYAINAGPGANQLLGCRTA